MVGVKDFQIEPLHQLFKLLLCRECVALAEMGSSSVHLDDRLESKFFFQGLRVDHGFDWDYRVSLVFGKI